VPENVRNVWVRFKSNKTGFVGLVFIAFCVLISLFGYLIAPDSTENANLQTLEYRLKEPGFKGQFLKVKKNISVPSKNVFSRIWSGKKNDYTWIPIESYTIQYPNITVKEYEGGEKTFHIVDVLHSIKTGSVKEDNGNYNYIDLEGRNKQYKSI